MFFNKKNAKEVEKCKVCKSKIDEEFSYCPYCGHYLLDKEQEKNEFGMLGKNDFTMGSEMPGMNLGITDKIIGSFVNNIMKNLDKQFREMEKSDVRDIPNGISIRISSPNANQQRPVKEVSMRKGPTSEQIKRISSLPKEKAKYSMKRLGNKITYNLEMPGIISPEDIFVSKLEKGYEIKAIGDKKVYLSTLPLDLPLKGFKLDKNVLTVEFKTDY